MCLIHIERAFVHLECVVAVPCVELFIHQHLERKHGLEQYNEPHIELTTSEQAWPLNVLLSNLWPCLRYPENLIYVG